MKLSIFTTATDPKRRGDNYKDALVCYKDLADEVIVVGSGSEVMKDTDVIPVHSGWPYEFNWDFIGEQFQQGYTAATGDWVIHADLDFLFHENDFDNIRRELEKYNDQPAVSFLKRQFILPDRFNVKSRLVVAVNKRQFGDRIQFNSGGDLCQPSLDGEYIRPGTVPDVRIPLWNYEKLLKTEAQIKDDVGRMARAWQRYFEEFRLGGPNDDSAYSEWLHMMTGRFQKPHEFIPWKAHPKYIRSTIVKLEPEQWGYSGFNKLEVNKYASSRISSR